MRDRHPPGRAGARAATDSQLPSALDSPCRAGPGMLHEGATNADMLAEIREVFRGLPTQGGLYRVRFWQADHHPGFIGEFIGMGHDMATGYPEPAL